MTLCIDTTETYRITSFNAAPLLSCVKWRKRRLMVKRIVCCRLLCDTRCIEKTMQADEESVFTAMRSIACNHLARKNKYLSSDFSWQTNTKSVAYKTMTWRDGLDTYAMITRWRKCTFAAQREAAAGRKRSGKDALPMSDAAMQLRKYSKRLAPTESRWMHF